MTDLNKIINDIKLQLGKNFAVLDVLLTKYPQLAKMPITRDSGVIVDYLSKNKPDKLYVTTEYLSWKPFPIKLLEFDKPIFKFADSEGISTSNYERITFSALFSQSIFNGIFETHKDARNYIHAVTVLYNSDPWWQAIEEAKQIESKRILDGISYFGL